MGFIASLWASLENPSFSLNDAAALDYLGGAPSSSGVRVTDATAMTHAPWWRGVALIAGYVGKVPLIVYKRGPGGKGMERAKSHPAFPLLRHKPYPFSTAHSFRKLLAKWALTTGNGYAYIYRAGDGSPLELWPLHPSCTYPVREDGRVWYVTDTGSEKRKLPYEDVLHIKGLSDDGLCGISVVQAAKEALGLGMASRRYASSTFSSGGRPSTILEHPGKLNDQQRRELRETWERMHSGLSNAHRTAVLDNGLKAHVVAFSNEDSQLIESGEFNLIDVANFLGLPPHKLGHTARTSYASLEQENQAFLDETLDDWFVTWEEECRDKLLTEEEKEADTHFVEFLRQAMVRADLTTRGNYYRTALGGQPWMTKNEVRSLENLNPVDDEGADEVMLPLNMGRPGGDPDAPQPVEEEEDDAPPEQDMPEENDALAAALRSNLEDAARRVVRRITLHARRTAKDSRAYCNWLDTFRGEHQDIATEILTPAAEAVNAWRALHLIPKAVACDLLEGLHRVLFAVTETCTAATLAGGVSFACDTFEATAPAALANRLMGDKP